jgi:pyruvate dehydrogenase E2 component (dihydrolipoamide acetyltransferase)
VSAELTMPKLSDSMADAVIVRWLKAPGDAFARGDALLEVETDKATVVYEAESDGTLGSILVPEGGTASIGQPIATLGNGAGPAVVEERPNATPVARRTAVQLGVSLHGLAGTGPGGRITRTDVESAAGTTAPPAPPPTDGDRVPLTATQATIARRMVESATTIPAFTVSMDVDLSLVAQLRKAGGGDDVPSLNDFVVKAVALTLRDEPRFNASWGGDHVLLHKRIDVGIAVAADGALLVPVVRSADARSLSEIAAETRRLADAARNRRLSPEELQGATFTVSNLGMFGVRSFTAIVDPPQVAILAVGGVRDDGVMTATLSCDHRVVYGADGARFLATLRDYLRQPLRLLA